MHILTLSDRITIPREPPIDPGDYLLTDINAADLLQWAGRGQMRPLPEGRPFDESKDWSGKKILFMRPGGFGDLILLTPVLRELKRRWPDCTIGVSTMRHYSCVFNGLPFVTGILRYPLPVAEANQFDAWIMLENAVELNPRARQIHMTDLFAEITGLSSIQDKQPAYRVSVQELNWCREQYPRKAGVRRLCVAPGASTPSRVFPIPLFGAVIGEFVTKGWEVLVLGTPQDLGDFKIKPHEGLRNLTEFNHTFRQSCAVMNNADCLLGNDSAMVHVAGALGTPAVALYGPFPWALRTAYSHSVTALQGRCPVSPCFHHVNLTKRNFFPDNCPSASRNYCEALGGKMDDKGKQEGGIRVSKIATTIELVARRFEPTEML